MQHLHRGGRMNAPTADELVDVMREIRDASSYDLNPHATECAAVSWRLGACRCRRAQRLSASWQAFHDALERSGVPRLQPVAAQERS